MVDRRSVELPSPLDEGVQDAREERGTHKEPHRSESNAARAADRQDRSGTMGGIDDEPR